MNELNTNMGGWSYVDQDYANVNRNGVGGATHTFRYAAGLHTNDRGLYSENGFNVTDRYLKGQDQKAGEGPMYHYKGADNKLKKLNLMNQIEAFRAAKEVNGDGKAHYSKCLDNKWTSSVQIQDKMPAGMSTKIQSKAYRANTQSQQVDGLYKTQKFINRPVLLNHTRTPYNIMNPN